MGLPSWAATTYSLPCADAPKMKFDLRESKRDWSSEAYSRFDEEYASAVKDMFAKNHLDSSPRFGKQNGAFCAGWYNGKSAFILNSFNGSTAMTFTRSPMSLATQPTTTMLSEAKRS